MDVVRWKCELFGACACACACACVSSWDRPSRCAVQNSEELLLPQSCFFIVLSLCTSIFACEALAMPKTDVSRLSWNPGSQCCLNHAIVSGQPTEYGMIGSYLRSRCAAETSNLVRVRVRVKVRVRVRARVGVRVRIRVRVRVQVSRCRTSGAS